MKKYIKPELKIEEFEIEDIITVSGGGSSSVITPDIDGGDVTYLEEWIRSWAESE